MIVAKFGGAILNSAEGFLSAVGEIRSLPRPLLVVVSAVADTTNRLESLAEAAVSDPGRAQLLLARLLESHAGIARNLLGETAYDAWHQATAGYRSRLGGVVEGVSIVRELSARTLDLIVHFGERYSSSLLLAALGAQGVSGAVGLAATDLIITDTAHRHAHPDPDLTCQRVETTLRPALGDDGLVITEGYIARGIDGQATTMGRESSDYSATLLAGFLGASQVRIYTGVQGILTADPAVVPAARTLRMLSYHTARTMAELGAKVLHPRTVTPVEEGNIPLVITALDGESTTITASDGTEECSVVLLPVASLLKFDAPVSYSRQIDLFVDELRLNVPVVWRYQFRREQQVVTAEAYNPSAHGVIGKHVAGAELHEVPGVSVVSLVRQRPLDTADMRRFFGALAGSALLAVHAALDRSAVSVVLDSGESHQAVRGLHAEFVESTGQ